MYLGCSYQSLAAQKVLGRIRGVHMHWHIVCIPVEDKHTLLQRCLFAVQGLQPVPVDPKVSAQQYS